MEWNTAEVRLLRNQSSQEEEDRIGKEEKRSAKSFGFGSALLVTMREKEIQHTVPLMRRAVPRCTAISWCTVHHHSIKDREWIHMLAVFVFEHLVLNQNNKDTLYKRRSFSTVFIL